MSDREKSLSGPAKKKALTPAEIDRIVEMAWEDRSTFETIRLQFGLTNAEVIKLMRQELKSSSFKLWRERTQGRKTKHEALLLEGPTRFKSKNQKPSGRSAKKTS